MAEIEHKHIEEIVCISEELELVNVDIRSCGDILDRLGFECKKLHLEVSLQFWTFLSILTCQTESWTTRKHLKSYHDRLKQRKT